MSTNEPSFSIEDELTWTTSAPLARGRATLAEADPEVSWLIEREERYEAETIRLIASENYASRAVLAATGSVLTNKYSEGYPHKRYYEGQLQVDAIEELAKARMKQVFGAEHVNVQPYSGSPANLAVYLAFVKPGETIAVANSFLLKAEAGKSEIPEE